MFSHNLKQGFSAKLVPLSFLLTSTLSIMIGYHIAVKNGDVQPFPLTDITHTTIHYPEYFIARIGFPITCVMCSIFFNLLVYFLRKYMNEINTVQKLRYDLQQKTIKLTNEMELFLSLKQHIKNQKQSNDNEFILQEPKPLECPQFIIYLGYLASLLFLISICVIQEKDMNWDLHIYGATGFFIICYINFFVVSKQFEEIWKYNPGFISQKSYNVKIYWQNLCSIAIILYLLSDNYSDFFPKWFGNFLEWILVLFLEINLSFYYGDFKEFGIQFLKQEQQQKLNYHLYTNNQYNQELQQLVSDQQDITLKIYGDKNEQ